MYRIARAHDGGVTVRVGEGVTQYQFGALHSMGKDIVEYRLCPNVVKRGSLDLRIRAAVGDATTNDNARAGFGGSGDQVMVLWG